ncbi:MAG: hypothetical protein ACI83H_002268 [Glaciecola sp.]|jgi:hypothetical protein
MIKKLCIVLLALAAFNIHAQEGTTSPYSFYGIGSLKFKGTTENRSMGGLSIYSDSIHINLRNPASYGGKNIIGYNNESRPIKFTVGGSHSNTTLNTSSNSQEASASTFDYLALSMPIGKLGVGFGLMPYTSVGYKLESLDDSGVQTHRYKGEGGVNKAFLGLGYLVAKDLKVGIDASYNFGNIQNSAIEFLYTDDGELIQYQSRESNRSDISGLNYNFGVTYTPMISEKLQLTTALTYKPQSELTSNNERTIATIVISPSSGQEFPVNDIEQDLEANGLKTTTLTLPSKLAFGAGIGQPRKWFVGAEYTSLKTSNFSNPIFSIDNATFEDASEIAFGGFYIPQYSSFNKYWKRMVYRAGMRFENTGLKINNEPIKEFGISFGVGIPIGRAFSNANFGFEFGKRGTTDQNLIKENFVNFQLSLSLNDRWFEKRKFN